MQVPPKRTIACLVAAVAVAAAWSSHSEPQKVKIYTSTNPTNYDPAAATLVLETVRYELPIPRPLHAPPKYYYVPECVSGAPQADCTAATDVYKEVQGVTKTLGDRQLGPGGTQHIIMMKNNHPDGWAGLYDPEDEAIILYPNKRTATLPHEVAHVYVDKHIGTATCSSPCTETEIKKWGVEEGFAMIVAHRATGGGYSSPSSESVVDIIAGCSLGTHVGQRLAGTT